MLIVYVMKYFTQINEICVLSYDIYLHQYYLVFAVHTCTVCILRDRKRTVASKTVYPSFFLDYFPILFYLPHLMQM